MPLKHNRYTRIGDVAKFREGYDRIFKPKPAPKKAGKVLAKRGRAAHKPKPAR